MKLDVLPLTKEDFAPFGDVIETEGSEYFLINNGSTRRYHELTSVELDTGSKALINIFQATPLDYPLNVKMVERHPKGSQSFMPLSSKPYLIVVAEKGESVKPEDLRAFIAKPSQGINYHTGTWHHPVLALQEVCDFLVVDRGGEGHNCDEIFFEEGTEIILEVPETL